MLKDYLGGGKKLGVLAVSAPTESGRLSRGLEVLRSFGVHEKVALNPSAAFGLSDYLFSSDSASARARALEGLFQDPEVGAVMSVRGAYGCMEMLPELDFELLARFPKPLVGFSDVTALLLALEMKSGAPSVHGPSIESFARAPEEPDLMLSVRSLVEMLQGRGGDIYSNRPLDLLSGEAISVSGVLRGGNLTLVSAICGTPWAAHFRDCILFLEETGESPYRIHRHLLQLKLAGAFEGMKAVLLGGFTNCVHSKGLGPDTEMVIRDIFGPLKVPVYRGAFFGHQSLNLPLPLGQMAELSVSGLRLV